jgi:hypothetical protein
MDLGGALTVLAQQRDVPVPAVERDGGRPDHASGGAGPAEPHPPELGRLHPTPPAAQPFHRHAWPVGEPFPARTTVYMQLPPGLLVEIDALAVLVD